MVSVTTRRVQAPDIELRWYAMAWIFFIILALNWTYEKRTGASRHDPGSASRPAPS